MKALLKSSLLVLMAIFYIAAGLNHFISPETYLKIVPPYLPQPLLLVQLSGVAEVLLGLGLLIPRTRPKAAWGIIALLIAVFPANIYMFHQGGAAFGTPDWVLLLRLPLQLVLILWAYVYTQDAGYRSFDRRAAT